MGKSKKEEFRKTRKQRGKMKETDLNHGRLFEIKEIRLQGTFKCQYAPGCDCSAY
jgi:hypothetical protein